MQHGMHTRVIENDSLISNWYWGKQFPNNASCVLSSAGFVIVLKHFFLECFVGVLLSFWCSSSPFFHPSFSQWFSFPIVLFFSLLPSFSSLVFFSLLPSFSSGFHFLPSPIVLLPNSKMLKCVFGLVTCSCTDEFVCFTYHCSSSTSSQIYISLIHLICLWVACV